MRSHTVSADLSRLCISIRRSSAALPRPGSVFYQSFRPSHRATNLKLSESNVGKCAFSSWKMLVTVSAMDEDSVGVASLDEWADNELAAGYMFSSSDDSDEEIILHPVTDADLPSNRERVRTTEDSLTVTAHRFAMLGRTNKKIRIKYGIVNNVGLMTFLTVVLLLLDWCAWRVVRLPLAPFFLTRPFLISAVIVSCAGYICVPLFRTLRICSTIEEKRPAKCSSKKEIPTMGGLFFVPIGVIVAEVIICFSSIEVTRATIVTLAFAAIGLLYDLWSLIKNHNNGLPHWMRILLEVAVGIWFSIWLYNADISSPYSIKTVVPLPAPVGLVCLGKFYVLLATFCFVAMGNGIKVTDRLDGLAGGIAAMALVGMSIAVLPICSDLAVFGASMAGACVGFLLYNRYKASLFMGNTGALALGGALAAMAVCTGMFFPLFISSGIFVMQAIGVIMQVSFFKSKCIWLPGCRLARTEPLHNNLELRGFKEPIIVAGAYIVSSLLVIYAGYVALISA